MYEYNTCVPNIYKLQSSYLSPMLLYFRFYLECLLPEIVDPLYGKRFELSDIREPEHIQEAQKKKVPINIKNITHV